MNNRIKELRLNKRVNQATLAEFVGVSQNTISYWEQGKYEPDMKSLQKIADYFGVTTDYLIGRTPIPPSGGRWVKVLGNVAAGIPIDAIEDVIDMEQLGPEYDAASEYVGLVIKGDSMEPVMSEGDVVIVRIQPDVDTGDTAVVFVNGDQATCKKIKKTPEGVMLLSTNPAYEPMYYTNAEIEALPLRIFGRVVELRKKF